MGVLMPSAVKDQVTVVQIESEGYNKQTVTVPICAMKGGVDLQKYIDLLVPGNAKIKIIHGEGPINLIGSHCVDYFGFKDDEEARTRRKETPRPRWRQRRPPLRRKARKLRLPRVRPPTRSPLRRRETLRRRLLLPKRTPRSAKLAPRPRVPRRKLRTELIFSLAFEFLK